MKNSNGMVTFVPEYGSGFYSDYSTNNKKVLAKAIPRMVDAVTSVPTPPGSVFTIADYGAADGGVSMPLMYACVKELRKRHGDELPIHVIYEDQPTNDVLALFKRIQGLIPGPPSFLLDFKNVYVTACGTSFYKQCLPNNSVTVGFSSFATVNLSDIPCHITNGLASMLIRIPEEREKFRRQAERDWERFLLHRAEELKPGGRFINIDLTINEEGKYNFSSGAINMYQLLNDVWKGMANEEGIISQEEYHKTTMATYCRTEEEFRKPFEWADSPVRKAGLELISIETNITPCRYHEKWMKDKGDAMAHAHLYMFGSVRRWADSVFRSGLCNSRTEENKTKIVDELFRRCAEEVAKNPEMHANDQMQPFTAHGSGFYSENALTNQSILAKAIPVMVDAVTSVPTPPGSVFTIADYGAADGGVSMPLMYACVKELRERHGDELPIHVIYEDQPTNDFQSLFKRLQGLIPGPPSFLLDFKNVYVTACGTSFYNQCLPNNSVTVGFSSIATHWLRDLPCHATGAIVHTLTTVPIELEHFRQQAERDWETFLLCRAAELKPGGKLINVNLAVNEKGEFNGHTIGRLKITVHELLHNIWDGMARDGLITMIELHEATERAYFRTVEELRKPFELEDSPVRKAGLELVSMETDITSCKFHERWMMNKNDARSHARCYTLSVRRWSDNIFKSALSDSRSKEEKARIVDELYNRMEEEVAKHPDDHAEDYVTATTVMKKAN